jgi:exodeoxyribonuclease V gamma subunit
LRDWNARGLLRYRYATAKAGDFIAAWLQHLCLNILSPEGVELKTRHVARDASFCFLPADQPQTLLMAWISAWREGLSQPLAFYPGTSWEWVTTRKTSAWGGNEKKPGEALDIWRQLALRGREEPLGENFQAISQQLLLPLLQNLDPKP